MSARRVRVRGFGLVSAALWLLVVLGFSGLAIDLGRMYVARSEAQAYADSAALAAALELDGTPEGLERARLAALAVPNRWDFASKSFSQVTVEFAPQAEGPWQSQAAFATPLRYAKVTAAADVPVLLLPALGLPRSARVRASAVAGQVPKHVFTEGVFPFSPFAHDPADAEFGFVRGQLYTLRWAANPKLNHNVCPGDNAEQWIALATYGSNSERGYIEETSSAIIRMAIDQDYQTRTWTIGAPVTMTGGAKQTQRFALINRVNQDSDPWSPTYAQYVQAGRGNGRRLVLAVINSGPPNPIVVGFGLFFLLTPESYPAGGNQPFCAEFIGPYLQGSRHKGVGPAGAYVARLVQ